MKFLLATFLLGTAALATIQADDRKPADDPKLQELRRIEGVWKSTTPNTGRSRVHEIVFQGGRMGWRSFETLDGKPLIGSGKLYDVQLDPGTNPKQITAIQKVREPLLGIYQVEKDELKLSFAKPRSKERPSDFADKAGTVLRLTRDRNAKLPDLVTPATVVQPVRTWQGQRNEVGADYECPEGPITSQNVFENAWRTLGNKNESPKVDFNKEFVIIKTYRWGTVTNIDLALKPGQEIAGAGMSTQTGLGAPLGGFTYMIAVFSKDLVDVKNGRISLKKK